MTKIDGQVSDLLAEILAEPEAMVKANIPETLNSTAAEELQQKFKYSSLLCYAVHR
ncbi:MAG: hypothetical protein F6K47_24330 [Symploca sp. SIO2E6]|nr:hypothetical protein [Symploca sp. SIO2E6]